MNHNALSNVLFAHEMHRILAAFAASGLKPRNGKEHDLNYIVTGLIQAATPRL